MRILYFSSRECWPPNTGGRLRDYHLAKELAKRAEVTYLGLRNLKDPPPVHPPAGVFQEHIIVDKDDAGYAAPKLLQGVFGPLPVTILNCRSRQASAALNRLLSEQKFDTVQLEGVHLVEYVKLIRNSRHRPQVVADWHNIESELMDSYAAKTANALRRAYACRTARLIDRAETRLLRECSVHTVTSEREQTILRPRVAAAGGKKVIEVVGNGVDVDAHAEAIYDKTEPGPEPRVIFVGSMDYHANIDAVTWFADDVWPKISAGFSGLRFTIVGRSPAPPVQALSTRPGIEVTGTVDDVRPYYRSAMAMLVPLRIGSGTRLKILEGMAAGVPVISTPLGAEGIKVAPGQNILIAETPQEFVQAVAQITEDAALRERLRNAGLDLVRSLYDWSILGDKLFDIHRKAAKQ